MSSANILKLDSLKVYFPYLDDRAGHYCPLRREKSWLLTYTLFSDCVICPPRSFFGVPHGIDNVATIYASKLLREMVESGVIIATATTDGIRDVVDLVERYSGILPETPITLDIPIYLRSERYQRRVSSDYMLNFLNSFDGIPSSIAEYLRDEFLRYPNSSQTNSMLCSIKSQIPLSLYEAISREAANSYFYGGAVGNGAIMPPPTTGAISHIYDHMYSKRAITPFLIKAQQILKSNLISVSPSKFLALRKNLVIFRHMYAELSSCCKSIYGEVISLISKKYAFSNIYVPVVIAQALAATALALAVGPLFTAAAAGIYIVGKLSWEILSKAFKINDYLSTHLLKILARVGVLPEYQKEVSEVMARFESSVAACISR